MLDHYDRSFLRAEADWLSPPDACDPSDEELDAAESHDRLCALEDAGCTVAQVERGEWRITCDALLLGGGDTCEAAVAAAWPVAVRVGLVEVCA